MVGAGHPQFIFHLAVHKVEVGSHQKEQEREDKVKWDLCLRTSPGSKDGLGAGKECTSVSRQEEEVGLDLPSVSYCCF